MNRTKFFAFAVCVSMFAACGSDNGSPPELSNNPATISPFDTLVVKFNSSLVDIDKLDESNIVLGSGIKQVSLGKSTGKELRFIGTNISSGKRGVNYFNELILNDSIVFNKLKNSDGYVKEKAVFYFSTLRILDKEPNGSVASANDIDLVGKVDEVNGVTFTGVLDYHIGEAAEGTIYDNSDYYTLKLKALDTMLITVVNRAPLEILVRDSTFSAAKGKSNVFTYIVGTDHLFENPQLTVNDLVPFYINVKDKPDDLPSNPYKITVKVKRKK